MPKPKNSLAGRLGAVARLSSAIFAMALTAARPAAAEQILAQPTAAFLDSIGVVSTFQDRGQPYEKTLEMLQYGGFRWLRGGIEGLSEKGPLTIDTFLRLHREAGVKISWGLVSGSGDIDRLLSTGRILAEADALLAFEGNNEPNNWPVKYKGREGGGRYSWLPVAELHADLYRRVKNDPLLKTYPVWSISEPGAQTDNVGLQFLEIPEDAGTLMPDGTRFADYANVHNYIYHPNSPHPADNKTWDAADPTSSSSVDGLYGNFGRTWANRYRGYSEEALADLPRVTTETGVAIGGAVDEKLQGLNLVNLYLSQFVRGYSYTSVYILRDRTDEQGNQTFGFFRPDFTPRLAADYLHNLTRILADGARRDAADSLDYEISPRPETVHDLLLQHSDGSFQLVVWGEALVDENTVKVRLQNSVKHAELYDAITGIAPVATFQDTAEIELKVSDHPLVLKLVF